MIQTKVRMGPELSNAANGQATMEYKETVHLAVMSINDQNPT